MTVRAVFLAILSVFVFAGTTNAAEGDVVEATGEAQVKNGNTVEAKKAATADALKKCIEKVVGIAIQSEFSAEQRELVQGNQDQFYSSVQDKLTTKADGFIQSYEIVGEAVSGDVMKVTVRAKVYESKIKAKARELAELLAKAGNPKLMLVIQEIYIDAGGRKRVSKESSVAAYLEKELLARGFELRGSKAAKNVADDSIETYDQWLDDAGGAAKMARDQGADILIAGRVEVLNKGVMQAAAGLEALEGQTRIELHSVIRGVNAASGEVLSTNPVKMTSYGTNEERAVYRALQGRGKNLIAQTFDQLLEDLKDSFRKTAERGQAFVVSLRGVSSFRKQGQTFLEAVKGVDGVSSVKQKSFAEGLLILDVAFKGSLHELQERIFSATEKTQDLGTLDIEGVSGKELSLKL